MIAGFLVAAGLVVAALLGLLVWAGADSVRGAASPATPTPALAQATSSGASVTEAAARSLALAIATHDDFHFTGADGPITNVRAEVLPFQTALRNLDEQQMLCGHDAALDATLGAVWVVTMDGDWPQNFPVLATPAPTWPSWRTLAVVLDAATGALVCVGARK